MSTLPRPPGPLCGHALGDRWIDRGTLSLHRHRSPRPLGRGALARRLGHPAASFTAAELATRRELSGVAWVNRFPTSASVDDLAMPLRENVKRIMKSARAFRGRPFVGIAVIDAAHEPHQTAPTTLRIAGDAARSCFSTEGFHVKTYRAGKQVANHHLGLGCDILRPTCRSTPASRTSTEY